MNDKDDLSDVCSVEEFSNRYPYLNFTRESFEYLLRNKEKNGLLLSGALVRIGRKYSVRSSKFREWYNRYININGRLGC